MASEHHNGVANLAYTYGAVGNIVSVAGTEATYLVKDHLGSTCVTLDSQGNPLEPTNRTVPPYLPFGADRAPGQRIDRTKYAFTDQERDKETGLYNYVARQYDPLAGRFLSPDWLLPKPFDPQQLNRYAYARNNPLKYTDPSGHMFTVSHAIQIFAGALIADYSIKEAWNIAVGNVKVDLNDKINDTTADTTNKHAMAGVTSSGTYQTRDEAMAQAKAIADGKFQQGTDDSIGQGLHTYQDSNPAQSPQHSGKAWKGFGTTMSSLESLSHLLKEISEALSLKQQINGTLETAKKLKSVREAARAKKAESEQSSPQNKNEGNGVDGTKNNGEHKNEE